MNTATTTQKPTPPFSGMNRNELEPLLDMNTRTSRLAAFSDYLKSSPPRAWTEDWRRSPGQLRHPPKQTQALSASYCLRRQARQIIRIGPESISCEGDPLPGVWIEPPASSATPSEHTHAQYNRAFWTTGCRLVSEANSNAYIQLIIAPPSSAPLWVPRIEVEAGKGSKLVIEEQLAETDSNAHVILCRALNLQAASRLSYAALTPSGMDLDWVENDTARVGRDAVLNWKRLHAGGRNVKSTFTCLLHEPGADASLQGLVLGGTRQHIDQRFLQIHNAPHTTSKSLYKTALCMDARSVYQGMIDVRPGCNQVDAYQTNNNLLLSKQARADSIPGLEIEAHDLSCSHGSTTGQPDPEQIFYLQSRGLNQNQSLKMIVSGFLEPIIEGLTEDMRILMQNRIDQHMEEAMSHEHG